MNGKCIFRGKKSFASALLAAAILAAMALLFSCGGGSASSGDSYVSGDFGTGGGDNTGNEGEGNGGENGDESGDGDEQSEKIANVTDVLKLVIGEAEYTKIAENVLSGDLTLTAQTIKIVGENFSGLETYKGKEKKLNNISGTHQNFISNNKEAFVAQDKELINITTSKLNSYTIPVKFSGEFNLSEISLPTTNDGKGDFSAATLIGSNISIDKLNTIRGTSLPTLQITNVTDKGDRGMTIKDVGKHAYNLYKNYSENLTKLQIDGDLNGWAVNGKEISDNSDTYTLLEDDGNTVKSYEDSSVKFLTIDALIKMHKQLKLAYFVNMIISGDAEEATDVDWGLTNIVFEGDMSKIKNTGTASLTGIVYFKRKAYNAVKQNVAGLLKLDSLEGVSNGTFNVSLSKNSAVLDVRGVGKKADSYTGGSILASGGYAHAIYFSNNDFDSIKNSSTEINKLTNKFSNMQVTGMGFINVYLGSDRVNGESYGDDSNQSIIGAKNPRSLKEFEYLGNYYEDNGSYRFEKSAKETYGNEFNNLSPFDQGKLNSNPYTIALNNKRCFSSTAKSLG